MVSSWSSLFVRFLGSFFVNFLLVFFGIRFNRTSFQGRLQGRRGQGLVQGNIVRVLGFLFFFRVFQGSKKSIFLLGSFFGFVRIIICIGFVVIGFRIGRKYCPFLDQHWRSSVVGR
jgi:hypothetical protein